MKHAAIIPLAGGAVIGASQSLKKHPEYMASWPAFAHNDSYAKAYYSDVPFYNLEEKTVRLPKVDIITCVPPCSGLSTATPSTARGCSAPQNEHMLNVAERGMFQGTKCIIIENAPTLYSPGGEMFANRFLKYTNKYGYSMVLLKTSTIFHGLPQNRIRSFVLLYKGAKIPEFNYIEKDFTTLNKFPVERSEVAKSWSPKSDEIISVLMKHFKVSNPGQLLKGVHLEYLGPVSAWKVFIDHNIKHRFKTAPYDYMQRAFEAGDGLMDRSPYLVYTHCNALMWKSAHKMINPAAPNRQLNIRELMNLMGMPKDYKEIPAKDINVLFQNVPVTTVKTLVDEVVNAIEGNRKWYKPASEITRINNIKKCLE